MTLNMKMDYFEHFRDIILSCSPGLDKCTCTLVLPTVSQTPPAMSCSIFYSGWLCSIFHSMAKFSEARRIIKYALLNTDTCHRFFTPSTLAKELMKVQEDDQEIKIGHLLNMTLLLPHH